MQVRTAGIARLPRRPDFLARRYLIPKPDADRAQVQVERPLVRVPGVTDNNVIRVSCGVFIALADAVSRIELDDRALSVAATLW